MWIQMKWRNKPFIPFKFHSHRKTCTGARSERSSIPSYHEHFKSNCYFLSFALSLCLLVCLSFGSTVFLVFLPLLKTKNDATLGPAKNAENWTLFSFASLLTRTHTESSNLRLRFFSLFVSFHFIRIHQQCSCWFYVSLCVCVSFVSFNLFHLSQMCSAPILLLDYFHGISNFSSPGLLLLLLLLRQTKENS